MKRWTKLIATFIACAATSACFNLILHCKIDSLLSFDDDGDFSLTMSQEEFDVITSSSSSINNDENYASSHIKKLSSLEDNTHFVVNLGKEKKLEERKEIEKPSIVVGNDQESQSQSNINITRSSKSTSKSPYSFYNATEYKQKVQESMNASPLMPTGSWIYGFWGGFCNQCWTFLGIIFLSNELPMKDIDHQHQQQRLRQHQHQHQHQQSNQIYVHSLQWKDLYGTNEKIRHEILFDVLYWNSFYPALPKLVSHYQYYPSSSSSSSSSSKLPSSSQSDSHFTDVYIHYDERGSLETNIASIDKIDSKLGIVPRMIWNATATATTRTIATTSNNTTSATKIIKNPSKSMDNATNPYPIGYKANAQVANNRYKQFSKRLHQRMNNNAHHHDNQQQHYHHDNNNEYTMIQQNEHDDVEMQQYKLIMGNALRPHPELQFIIDQFKSSIQNNDNGQPSSTYMVLHARIEPDMQLHPVCPEKKVTNITNIINSIYNTFPNPPSSTLILLLNKELLEKEARKSNDNTLANYNLHVVNDLLQHGMWSGQTKVIEAGSQLAIESNHDIYSKYSTLVGGIINFFLSLDASIFIGTEVSSYSTSVVNSRYFRHGGHDDKEADHRNSNVIDNNMKTKLNFFYTPNGLEPKESIHWFHC